MALLIVYAMTISFMALLVVYAMTISFKALLLLYAATIPSMALLVVYATKNNNHTLLKSTVKVMFVLIVASSLSGLASAIPIRTNRILLVVHY